jgi:iron(II)-dependent oxidoreductase
MNGAHLMDLEWILIPGGTCQFGDDARPVPVTPLWWTRTPLTSIGSRLPLTGLTAVEAGDVAGELGGRLPRSVEWEWMAAGASRRPYPWGEQPWRPDFAALAPAGQNRPGPVDAHPGGATPEGMLGVAGNVWEWTATRVMGDGAAIRGGSYASKALYARCTFRNAAPVELRSPGIGFRVVKPA